MGVTEIDVDRRTLLKTSAWAAPLIAVAIAAPRAMASVIEPQGVTARPDWVGERRALTVETTEPGTPIPAGVYRFTTTGGVSPDAMSFTTEPDLSAMITPAADGESSATVTLLPGHPVTMFTAYLALAEVPSGTGGTIPTMTVTLPTGGGATIDLTDLPEQPEEPQEPQPTVGFYGPTGGHWPSRTPAPSDTFDSVVEVDPTWAAIGAAIATATAQHPNGKVKIRVRPGTIADGGSGGAGSSARGVLTNLGAAGRAWRILVVPRDGWGTVTAAGTIETARGYAFVGLRGITLAGFDFTGKTVLLRNSSDVALAWSTFGVLNITGNQTGDTSGVELVECALPDALDSGYESDRMAFRVGDGRTIENVQMSGCYVAPSYKAAGSSSHTDSLQTSGTGSIRNLSFTDTVFFPSSSQTLQFEVTSGVAFVGSAVIAGLRAVNRYPIPSGMYVQTLETALNGKSVTGVTVRDSVVMGAIANAWSFDSVTNGVVAKPTTSTPANGSWMVDATLPERDGLLSDQWYGQHCPHPTRARLSSIWAGLAA